MYKICIFAGTSEGRMLAERISGRGARITACVATEYGEALLKEGDGLRICAGRMDQRGMEELLRREKFDLVVDATHPYADRVTVNIAAACACQNIRYMRLLRSSDADTADGLFVEDAQACAEYLKGQTGNILLTIGSKELSAFCQDAQLRNRIYARVLPMPASLDICAGCGIIPSRIIAMQGPFDEEMNIAMLRFAQAKFIVTKDTGSAGGYAQKISAARKTGVQAVIIGRPAQREGLGFEDAARLIEAEFALQPPKKKVSLVGIGMGNSDTRTLGMMRALKEAQCVIGARRMLESVDTTGKRVHEAVLADRIADLIRGDDSRSFAVLFSGDTGFYSGAKGVADALAGEAEIEILPGIGSLQFFCAQLGRSWADVRAVSLHGRTCDLAGEARMHPAVFALTGGADGVNEALARLQKAGMGELSAHVGERLGYPDERISHGTVNELIGRDWSSLSVILAENPRWRDAVVTHGLPDEAFDRDETPMTKSEIRSLSLSKLQLTQGAIVYDVGSGSGSISVEAALQASAGRVYAIEMKEKALTLTRRNADKFHLTNLEAVSGRAPEALEDLPAPTHAFIGGSTGSLRPILDCLKRKNPQVRIVVNAVTMETLAELIDLSGEFDFCDVTEVSIAKPREIGRYHLMTAQNPVYIYTLQNLR